MLSVISVAIYATFSAGIKIWQKTNNALPQEDVNIFCEKLEIDLRNSFQFTDIDFIGGRDKLSFPSIVSSRRLDMRTIGEVTYLYKHYEGTVTRERRDFSHISRDNDGIKQDILEGVRYLKFKYYFFDKQNKKYVWESEYVNKRPPAAVRVEVGFKDYIENDKFIKTVYIPTGE